MKLYLMRHGKANPENIDPGKSLSVCSARRKAFSRIYMPLQVCLRIE